MLEMANQLSEDEEYSHALKFYKSILQIEPTNFGVIIDYGVTLQNLGFYHQALTMYDTVSYKHLRANETREDIV